MAAGKKTGGRKKGAPNKVTADARAAISAFVDGNAGKLQEWLDEIGAENPEKAFNLFMSVVEYHVPKLARTEMTGPNGKELPRNVVVNVIAGPRS